MNRDTPRCRLAALAIAGLGVIIASLSFAISAIDYYKSAGGQSEVCGVNAGWVVCGNTKVKLPKDGGVVVIEWTPPEQYAVTVDARPAQDPKGG